MVAVPLIWELFQRDETNGMRAFRLLVAIAAIVRLAGVAYIKVFRQERTDFTAQHNEQSPSPGNGSRQVGGMGIGHQERTAFWFGDLETMFGLPSDKFVGRMDDFFVTYMRKIARQKPGQLPTPGKAETLCDGVPRCQVDGTPSLGRRQRSDSITKRVTPSACSAWQWDITERKHAEDSLRLGFEIDRRV